MRRAALLIAVAALACGPKPETPSADTSGTAAANSPQAATTADDRAAIEGLRSSWAAGAEKKDSTTVGGFYSDDAIMQFPGAPLTRGRGNIEKALAGAFGMTSNLKINSEGIDVSGDLAVDHGSYSEHVAPPGGKAMDVNGRYVVVLKKGADGWKITNHIGWLPPAK